MSIYCKFIEIFISSSLDNVNNHSSLEGTEFFAKYLADDLENPRVVSVTGIPKAAKEDDIKRFFSQFKEIEDFFQEFIAAYIYYIYYL